MSTEANKERTRRAYDEFINKGNVAAADEYVHPNYTGHFPGFPTVQGLEAFKQFVSMQNAAFSERQVTLEDVLAEGDKVAVRLTFHGTHTGELMGIPPTGKQVTYSAINIFRIVDDKAVEQWANIDNLTMLQQLGVIPTPGQASS